MNDLEILNEERARLMAMAESVPRPASESPVVFRFTRSVRGDGSDTPWRPGDRRP